MRVMKFGVALLVATTLAGCGGEAAPVAAADPPAGPINQPPAPAGVECGSTDFPCSLVDVSVAVITRGEQLANTVMTMLDGGTSAEAVLEYLRGQADVADSAANSAAIRFRLRGGRDVFILNARPAGIAPSLSFKATSGSQKVVVGAGADQKRALVLSPFKHYFGTFDDGAAVAQRLESTRGYAGQVSYRENATKTATTVGIQQFGDWENYDVIHVTGHGAEVCDVNRCVATILTGDIYSDAADLLRLTELGLNTAHVRGDQAKYLALGADYFRHEYPAGLDSKLIFFNGCQTYSETNSDLRDALLGPNSVFLGWTDIVESGASTAAALALFQDLSVNGVTAQRAFDKLGALAIDRHTFEGRQIEATLRLARAANSDLRIREVVRLERPTSGGELPNDGIVQVVGTANDGIVDMVPYQILVEGIPEAQQDSAIVQFHVESFSSMPQTVSAGERVGDTGWRLSGQIPFRDVNPEQRVEMRATLQLPEGGTSEHRVSVDLRAGSVPQAEVWVGQGVYHLDSSAAGHETHVTVVANVTFHQDPTTIGARYKYLDSVGGTMTWMRSGTVQTAYDGPCTYNAGPVEVMIPDGDGQIIVDTSRSPATYSMAGLTQGPTIRVAENCGNYAFTTQVSGAWAPAIGSNDGFTVSADGSTITGVDSNRTANWEWTFRRQ